MSDKKQFADTWPESSRITQEALDKLAAIRTVCLRHNNSGVITSTHILASKVLAIIGEKEGEVSRGS